MGFLHCGSFSSHPRICTERDSILYLLGIDCTPELTVRYYEPFPVFLFPVAKNSFHYSKLIKSHQIYNKRDSANLFNVK